MSIHICTSNIDFRCPYCEKEYSDTYEKYLNRINKNKLGITTMKCDCGKRFGIACDYAGLVSFKLATKEELKKPVNLDIRKGKE